MTNEDQDQKKLEELWEAARTGDCRKIRVLTMHGVDVAAPNDKGFSAFNIATQNNQTEAATTILAAIEAQRLMKMGLDPYEDLREQKTSTLMTKSKKLFSSRSS